jgi:hypothetical protein
MMICNLKQEAVFAELRQLRTARFILDDLNSMRTGVNFGVLDARPRPASAVTSTCGEGHLIQSQISLRSDHQYETGIQKGQPWRFSRS